MKNVSVWIDETQIRKFPTLRGDISAEVLVVEAGVTGITTAYLLEKAGPSEFHSCNSPNERLGLISK